VTRESLVTDAACAIMGTVTRKRTGAASLFEAQRWAAAACGRDPIYGDEPAAHAAGHRAIVTSWLFLPCIAQGVVDPDRLRADGIPVAQGISVPLKASGTMFGGEGSEFTLPIYPGDTITAEPRIAGIVEKAGAKGPFVLTTTETVCTNQPGDVAGNSRSFSISR